MQTDQIPPLATSAATKLQIQSGMCYLLEDCDEKSKPAYRDTDLKGEPCWVISGNFYNDDGTRRHADKRYRVLAPWPDTPAPEGEKPEIKLVVGQEVETEFGRRGIVEANPNALGNNEHKFIVQYPSRRVAYTENGSYYGDGEESHLDIVRIISQPAPTAPHEKDEAKFGEDRVMRRNEIIEKGDYFVTRDAETGPVKESIGHMVCKALILCPEVVEFRTRRIAPAPAPAASEAPPIKHDSNGVIWGDGPSSHESLTGVIQGYEAEIAALRLRVAELEQYKDLYRRAIRSVDEVFQDDGDNEPILPNYCKLGKNKFQAVITLAEEFKELTAERDQLRSELAKLQEQLAAAKREPARIWAELRRYGEEKDKTVINAFAITNELIQILFPPAAPVVEEAKPKHREENMAQY